MRELREKLKKFVEERDWDRFHTPKNLAMALSVEVAEVVEHFQWMESAERLEIPEKKRFQIRDELGDVLIYLVQLSEKLGIDPVEAAHQKIEKNIEKYPADRVRGKSLKYSEYP
jgi:dCTP diphosphatase